MLKLLLSKELFEDILNNKEKIVIKDATKHWKKELFEVSILNENIVYNIKNITKIEVANEYGEDKPNIILECNSIVYNEKKSHFEFHLGKIIQSKNVVQDKDYRDILIAQLLKEKKTLQESIYKDRATQLLNKDKFELDLLEYINKKDVNSLSVTQIVVENYSDILKNHGESNAVSYMKNVINKLKKYTDVLNIELYKYSYNSVAMFSHLPKDRVEKNIAILNDNFKNIDIFHQRVEIKLCVKICLIYWRDFLNIEKFREALNNN